MSQQQTLRRRAQYSQHLMRFVYIVQPFVLCDVLRLQVLEELGLNVDDLEEEDEETLNTDASPSISATLRAAMSSLKAAVAASSGILF